jgi:phage tail-like protein
MPDISKPGKQQRAFYTGRFVLELENADQDMVISVDGGNFKSEAVGEKVGADGVETRYPGRQKWDDITITIGTSMSPRFWQWIKKSIENKPERRSGAIITCDFDGNERVRRDFKDALISEIQFPALDAKAKNPAFLTIKISPETMEWKELDGKRKRGNPDSPTQGPATKQKLWIPANFRFRLDGFPEGNMKWVQKVDQFSIKQNIINNPIGKELYIRKEAGRIEYPNLTFYVAEPYAKPWLDHWKEVVGDNTKRATSERTAGIEYLSSDLGSTLMNIDFQGVGITGVSFDKHEAGNDAVRFVKVECYTETMTLEPKQGTV